MRIATFGPGTGWSGREITHEDGVFTLEGHGPITVADVMNYERQGQLVWAYDGLREWVGSQRQAATPKSSPSAKPETRRKSIPRWLVLLAILLALLAAISIWFGVVGPALQENSEEQKEAAVRHGLFVIENHIGGYRMEMGFYPPADMVNRAMLREYFDVEPWPTNPYNGQAMAQGRGPGHFTYTLNSDDRYELVGYGGYGGDGHQPTGAFLP